MQIHNRLAEIRQKRGIGAAALAKQVDVRRQTIYAIEAGTYIPNTLVSLRLAEVLEVQVEDLFRVERKSAPPQLTRSVEMLSRDAALEPGQPVRLCRVGKKSIGIPARTAPETLPFADGVFMKAGGGSRASVRAFESEEEAGQKLLIAGCDPAVSVLGRFLAKEAGVELIPASCSSLQAIKWLKAGKVHIAGSHLRDHRSGESNLPIVKKWFPAGSFRIVTFAQWEQGLVVGKGDRKEIRGVGDLARKNIQMVNREKGSGSRALLDELLDKNGIERSTVKGYNDVALGHIPAAWRVYSGLADCCVATRAAAIAFGLDFIPLASERYDFIFRESDFELGAIQVLLDVINRSAFQHELETLACYDMKETGRVVV